jgi:hypothetical protein
MTGGGFRLISGHSLIVDGLRLWCSGATLDLLGEEANGFGVSRVGYRDFGSVCILDGSIHSRP